MDISSKRLSWLSGFLLDALVGLSDSPGITVPLNPDSELHSLKESVPVLKIQDLALNKFGMELSSTSKSNS